MDSQDHTPILSPEREIYYSREFGRILVERPAVVVEAAKQLPFVFEVFKDTRKGVTVITRRVETLTLPGRQNHKIVDIKTRKFVDFSENEVEDVLAVIRRGLA